MLVKASWLFNRIVEEPERLKNNLVRDMNLELSRGTAAYTTLAHYFERYKEVGLAEKEAASIRLEDRPKIEIVLDHKYVDVVIK